MFQTGMRAIMRSKSHQAAPKAEHQADHDRLEMDWASLQILAETANANSLRDAARRSGLSVATIIRHLEKLERKASQPIYKRNEKRLVFTEYGKRLQLFSIEIRDMIRFKTEEAHDTSQLKIRISIDNIVNEILLCYNNQKFFEIISEYNLVINNFIERQEIDDADITMSLDRFSAFNSNIVRLCSMGFSTFASVEYITSHGIPRDRRALEHHVFGVLRSKDRFEFPNIEEISKNCARIITSNSQNIILNSVLKGQCIGVLPIHLLQNHKNIIPIDIGCYHERDIWIYIKKESKSIDKIGSLIKEIRNCFDERKLGFIKNVYGIFS
jgi:DNA-binding transcriptional LysR family regulator